MTALLQVGPHAEEMVKEECLLVDPQILSCSHRSHAALQATFSERGSLFTSRAWDSCLPADADGRPGSYLSEPCGVASPQRE